jgi:hypothetical protein
MSASDLTLLEPEHVNAIGALAEETNQPVEEVTGVYIAALGNLRSSARIQEYLVVLTSKKVRDALRQSQGWLLTHSH